MDLNLTNDTIGTDKSNDPPFRATPSGFSVFTLFVTQGCATFVLLTSLHPGLTYRRPVGALRSNRAAAQRSFYLAQRVNQWSHGAIDTLSYRVQPSADGRDLEDLCEASLIECGNPDSGGASLNDNCRETPKGWPYVSPGWSKRELSRTFSQLWVAKSA